MGCTLWETDFREFELGNALMMSVPGGFTCAADNDNYNAWNIANTIIDESGNTIVVPEPGGKLLFGSNLHNTSLNYSLRWHYGPYGFDFSSKSYEIYINFQILLSSNKGVGFTWDNFQLNFDYYSTVNYRVGFGVHNGTSTEWNNEWFSASIFGPSKRIEISITRSGDSTSVYIYSNGAYIHSFSSNTSRLNRYVPFGIYMLPKDTDTEKAQIGIRKITVKLFNPTSYGTIKIKHPEASRSYKVYMLDYVRYSNFKVPTNNGLGCIDLALPNNTKIAGSEPVFIKVNDRILRLRPDT